MGYMNFENKILEDYFRSFKWTRNNTVLLFESALIAKKLDYKPNIDSQHSILYQFQCDITTTDYHIRKLTTNKKIQYGLLTEGEKIISKQDIRITEIKKILEEQLAKLEEILKVFDTSKTEEHTLDLQSLINHELLHQGQLVVLFREAGIDFPERFQKAWDV
jgi:hypothetical protein